MVVKRAHHFFEQSNISFKLQRNRALDSPSDNMPPSLRVSDVRRTAQVHAHKNARKAKPKKEELHCLIGQAVGPTGC
jgi:hypothetical protein